MTDAKTPGTEVAVRKPSMTEQMLQAPDAESRILAYQTATRLQQSKLLQEAARELANISWGENLSEHTRFAVARWALQAGVDPARHIYILGGKIYDNAELYIDKCASLPTFDHAEKILLAPLDLRKFDPAVLGQATADALREEQRQVNAERLRLQIQHGVPADINEYPDSAAAYLVRLHFKDGTVAEGVNWAGSRGRKRQTRNGPGGASDPVGDLEPVKTALTRAYRKAAKQKIPVWFKDGGIGALFDQAELGIASDRAQLKAAGLDPDEPRPESPEGPHNFQRAMQADLDKAYDRAASPAHPVAVPEDPYAGWRPEGDETEDEGVDVEVVEEAAPTSPPPVTGSGKSFQCARCLNVIEGEPRLMQPGERGVAKYCDACAAAVEG